MVKLKMTPREMGEMYQFNCARRETLLAVAMEQKRPEDRMKFVVDYFLNKLDAKTIARIDGTNLENFIPFKYDYSFLEDYGSADVRRREDRLWGQYNYGFSLSQVDNDDRGAEKIKIFPAVYALKMGTCIMFASEIQRFAHDFGIDSRIVQKMDYCYDNFDGVSTENKPIQTDRIIKMQHFYNVLTIGDKNYKIDIAGYLTAQDLKRNHPEYDIHLEDFYFSQQIDNNHLMRVVEMQGKDLLNLSQESQPQ